MKVLKTILRTERTLKRIAGDLGINDLEVRITGYMAAETRKEGGKLYSYPESIEVKIENWSNHFYSVRTSDGRWIREGTDLSGEGLSTFSMARRMIREMKQRKSNMKQGA